ncbi:MAG: HIT domain-containing protein [Candidatus Brocadiaceae bacterium]|jgi:ATP adenylyltransferase
MDQLWAPWRIGYVAKADKDEEGCFLCRAAEAGDDRGKLVLWRTDACFCLMNRWPYNNGHLLVAPTEHKADLLELSPQELAEQVRMIQRCKRNLEAALQPAGFNVGLNLGEAAGAGLASHLHWHVVPRWQGDTNYMPVLADTKVIPQALDSLYDSLREVDAD